jgi:uncharacterized SAM-binding protein YcdF (DUF218 family)
MIKFLSSLISPMTVLFLLITGCLVQEFVIMNTILRGRRRKPRWLLLITISWFFIISTKPVPLFLANLLENRYQVFDTAGYDIPDTAIYIAVPGAGYYNEPSLPAIGKLSPASIGRLTEAVRVHNLIPNSFIVTFGQAGEDLSDGKGVFARAAIEAGVDSGRILQIGQVVNTRSEAAALNVRFGTYSGVIVVTDAVHMTRAMKYFNEYGLNPIAAPANFTSRLSSKHGLSGWIPSTDNINTLSSVVHELGGLAYYKLILNDNIY